MGIPVKFEVAVANGVPYFFLCFGLLEHVAFVARIVLCIENVITVTATSDKAASVFVSSNFFPSVVILFMLFHEFPTFYITVELSQAAALEVLLLCGHFFCPHLLIIRGEVFVKSLVRGQEVWGIGQGFIYLFCVPVETTDSVTKTLLDFRLNVTF